MEVGVDALPDPAEPPTPMTRDWSELPCDALLFVFTKLDLFDTLMGAGLVCHSWLDAAKVPSLWRCIDMADGRLVEKKLLQRGGTDVLRAMAKVAVERSDGELQGFFGREFVTVELLNYIGDRAPSLKALHLISCDMGGGRGFAESMKKFPLLEELELAQCTYLGNGEAFEIVGKACRHLKCFKLIYDYARNSIFEGGDPYIDFLQSLTVQNHNSNRGNDEAFGIATMTGLHTLQLVHCNLSNLGLTAILDGCPHLDSLDIRQCFVLEIDSAMKARLASLKTLRLSFDPVDDCEELVENPDWYDYYSYAYDHYGDYAEFCDFGEYL